ncbi:peptide transporter [Marinilactibacillus sp. 15R]|uniref:Manganese/zinc/iron transport system ATP-binding protein n=1 Tax=Marinilactibacillus piezotolerans TaxID=258723 RepID=A0A1I3YW25_9LACT|nr:MULTISPECIES: metal ABC transporter ATP-binding protein [Marinilactibacillus]API88000.1 peptide transporter [Marinilactibacillus sp. 15R]SFK35579.1 manganese/zinc/iron transport system ATP-binding protein [Marinilactibacillus piezotolerans]
MEEQKAIDIHQLTVAYDAKPVLWNTSVAFKKGKLTAIVGPNGAGKSTLIKTILDFIKPVTGQIEYFVGKQSSEYKEIKNHIAYVPQNSTVDWDFPATVLDVVLMGRYGHLGWFKRPRKKDKDIAKEMLVKVGMPSFSNRQISQLSGGQRQRVFLARALAQEAEIYMLDEPLAGVDMKTEHIIMDLLKELTKKNKTVIVVHHDLQTVEEYFDEVIFINQEVLNSGPVSSVFTKANIEETYRQDRNLGEEEDT